MPLKSSEQSSLRYTPITEREYDYLHELARDKQINLSMCPTCDNRQEELAPGIKQWPDDATYKLGGEYHPCNCAYQVRLMKLYLLAGIPMDYWTLSTKDFYGDTEALEAAQIYIEHYGDLKHRGMGLSFYSPTMGTGKTMLASLIAKELVKRGEKVYFVHFTETLRTYQMPWEERQEEERRLRHTPWLILDEVRGAITDAQWGLYANQLEELIRFRTSGNAVTITTTNLTYEQLDEDYSRTFSLLAAKQRFIHVNGEDVRRAGKVDLDNYALVLNGERKPIV